MEGRGKRLVREQRRRPPEYASDDELLRDDGGLSDSYGCSGWKSGGGIGVFVKHEPTLSIFPPLTIPVKIKYGNVLL